MGRTAIRRRGRVGGYTRFSRRGSCEGGPCGVEGDRASVPRVGDVDSLMQTLAGLLEARQPVREVETYSLVAKISSNGTGGLLWVGRGSFAGTTAKEAAEGAGVGVSNSVGTGDDAKGGQVGARIVWVGLRVWVQ